MMSNLDQLHKSVYYSVLSLVLLLVESSGLPAQSGQRFKQIDYHYDLISGKVNEVLYQANQPDAFYHKYEYDADNRITKVHTSKDNIIWDQDASYTYYAQGPLARVELGDNKVQGMDYAYTLQGWIKGVNSNLLKAANDIGNDGLSGSTHSRVAKDAFGYTLNYHVNDYQPIDATKWSNTVLRFEALTPPNSDLMAARFDLHNGNISSMVTTIVEPKVYTGAANQVPNILPQATAYQYDQLNRLLEMKAFQNLDAATNAWKQGSTYAGLYHNVFKYDANGNILYQERAGQNGLAFDKLTYQYKTDASGQRRLQNRLYHVNDGNTNTALGTDDIEDQGNFTSSPNINGVNNYQYDEIGNLKHDAQEEIDKIEWTVYGKIKSITRTAVSLRSDLEFQYDASGNRIAKIEKPRDANGAKPPSDWIVTYYTRDAQGNVMGIYKHQPLTVGPSFKAIERNIFGSSRLGSDYTEVELISPLPTANPSIRVLGLKHFEGNNHLGNVLAVVSDRKIPRDDDGDGMIEYFQTEVLSAQDYSPFGTVLNGRIFGNSSRYGFNGKEKDDEFHGNSNDSYDFAERLYDPRLGKFLSIDKFASKYPFNSPYHFAGNNPICFVDMKGDSIYYVNGKGEVSNIGVYQWEPAANEGWKEGEKFGYSILISLPESKDLIYKYANSSTHDTYIMVDDFPAPPPGQGTGGMGTVSGVESAVVKGGKFTVTNNPSFDATCQAIYKKLEGVTVKNKNAKISLIAINTDYMNKKGDVFSGLTVYDMAESFYHELQCHIDEATGDSAKDHANLGVPQGDDVGVVTGDTKIKVTPGSKADKIIKALQKIRNSSSTVTDQSIPSPSLKTVITYGTAK